MKPKHLGCILNCVAGFIVGRIVKEHGFGSLFVAIATVFILGGISGILFDEESWS